MREARQLAVDLLSGEAGGGPFGSVLSVLATLAILVSLSAWTRRHGGLRFGGSGIAGEPLGWRPSAIPAGVRLDQGHLRGVQTTLTVSATVDRSGPVTAYGVALLRPPRLWRAVAAWRWPDAGLVQDGSVVLTNVTLGGLRGHVTRVEPPEVRPGFIGRSLAPPSPRCLDGDTLFFEAEVECRLPKRFLVRGEIVLDGRRCAVWGAFRPRPS